MTFNFPKYDPHQVRKRLHHFAVANKKKLRLKFPFEKRMDSITFWLHRFYDRYENDICYQLKIDNWIFISCSAMLGIILGVVLAMIYGVITH